MLEDLNQALAYGRSLEWNLVAPLIRIPHENGKYLPPVIDHGTHVAGILAGDWKSAESDGILEEDLDWRLPRSAPL